MKMYLLTQVFINNFKINFIALSVRNFESKEIWTCLLNEIDMLNEASFFEEE